MKTCTPTLCLSIFLIIASCSSYRYVDIQILNPGAITFPTKNLKLIIIDPSKTESISRDSVNLSFCHLAIKNFNSTFIRQLKQSPLFQDTSVKIQLTPINIHYINSNEYIKQKILLDSLLSIHHINSNEYIKKKIYLDSLKKLYSNLNENPILLWYGFQLSCVEVPDFYGIKVLNGKFLFELSNLRTREIYNWYQTPYKQKWWSRDPTDDGSQAIINASKEMAKSYARRLAPYWTTEERKICYSPNRKMRRAYAYFCDNDMDRALEVWKRLYDIGTRQLASRAAYNMALVYEMQDDLNSCENWLVKSILKKVNQTSREYLDIIRNRKLARVSLDNQL